MEPVLESTTTGEHCAQLAVLKPVSSSTRFQMMFELAPAANHFFASPYCFSPKAQSLVLGFPHSVSVCMSLRSGKRKCVSAMVSVPDHWQPSPAMYGRTF